MTVPLNVIVSQVGLTLSVKLLNKICIVHILYVFQQKSDSRNFIWSGFDDSLQMGSRCKKALVAESVRKSLHSWCKRVKHKSKHDSLHSHTARSVCSLESTIDERDEITVVSGTLTRSSSLESLNQITVTVDQLNLIWDF